MHPVKGCQRYVGDYLNFYASNSGPPLAESSCIRDSAGGSQSTSTRGHFSFQRCRWRRWWTWGAPYRPFRAFTKESDNYVGKHDQHDVHLAFCKIQIAMPLVQRMSGNFATTPLSFRQLGRIDLETWSPNLADVAWISGCCLSKLCLLDSCLLRFRSLLDFLMSFCRIKWHLEG